MHRFFYFSSAKRAAFASVTNTTLIRKCASYYAFVFYSICVIIPGNRYIVLEPFIRKLISTTGIINTQFLTRCFIALSFKTTMKLLQKDLKL